MGQNAPETPRFFSAIFCSLKSGKNILRTSRHKIEIFFYIFTKDIK